MPQNVVYFLGAGASKNFGYPLTSDIMPQILNRLRRGTLFKNGNKKSEQEIMHEAALSKYINILYPGLKNINPNAKNVQIPLITEVLSMVDHCCLYNIPPHPELNEDALLYFRKLINRAVAEILDDYDRKKYTPEETTLLEKFIEPIRQQKTDSNVTIITTNYDRIIDKAFWKEISNRHVDLGIPYRDILSSDIVMQPQSPLFRYYKLHGSLNWLKCELCGHYYVNHVCSIVMNAFVDQCCDANTCDCSSCLRLTSVLVAPSVVRDIRDSNLLQIWKSALEAIRTADKLIMVGYSLPGEDLGIKSILMRGINGRSKKNELVIDVVQHKNRAKNNYLNFFGSKINYFPGGLKEYLGLSSTIESPSISKKPASATG